MTPNHRRRVVGTEQQSLKVMLTEAERVRKQTELLACHADLSTYDRDETEIKAQLKRRKSGIETRLGGVVQLLQAGFEFRPVTVERIADYDDGLIRLVRVDTGEEIEIERMSETDRQTVIDFPPVADGYAEAGGPGDPYGAPNPGAPIAELTHEPGDVVEGEFVDTPPVPPPEASDATGLRISWYAGPPVPPPEASDATGLRISWYAGLSEDKVREDLESLEIDDVRAVYARLFPGEVVGRAQKRTLIPAILKRLATKAPPPPGVVPTDGDDPLPF